MAKRSFFASSMIGAAFVFVVGGIAAWLDWIDKNIYIFIISVVGIGAQLVSLVTLSQKSFSAETVKEIDSELIHKLAESTKVVRDYEQRISVNKEEINRIEQQRAEIELLVRQASLAAFMEERLRFISTDIERRVTDDSTLVKLLNSYTATSKQAGELGVDIARSEHAELIKGILVEVQRSEADQDQRAKRKEFYITVFGNKLNIAPMFTFLNDAILALAITTTGSAQSRRRD